MNEPINHISTLNNDFKTVRPALVFDQDKPSSKNKRLKKKKTAMRELSY